MGFTPNQLQSFLEERAVDMGPVGPDTQFGYGRLFLGDPSEPGQIPPPLLLYLPVIFRITP
jgi:hypothetical protein